MLKNWLSRCMASGAALLVQNSKFCYETLRAVCSCHHGPTICNVSSLQTIQKCLNRLNTTFGHLGRSQAAVSAPNGRTTLASSQSFRAVLCMLMWSEHGMTQPHAKYRHHKQVRSRSKKMITTFWPCWALTTGFVSAKHGQYLAIRRVFSAATYHMQSCSVKNGREAILKNEKGVYNLAMAN
jgi:hypothetical protein